MSYYTGTFLVGAHSIWGFISKTTNIFWNILVLPIDYSLNEKNILGIFVYLFLCKVMTTKVNFRFYKECSQAVTSLICKRAIFAQDASIAY